MSQQDAPSVFTWTTPEGAAHEVELSYDVDQWNGREIRAAEALGGGRIGALGWYGTQALCIAISVARVVPGATVQSVDAELTLGRVRAIIDQIKAREAAAVVAAEPADDEAVLSPTKPAGEDDAPPVE